MTIFKILIFRELDVPSTEASREFLDPAFSSDVKSTKHQRPLSLGK